MIFYLDLLFVEINSGNMIVRQHGFLSSSNLSAASIYHPSGGVGSGKTFFLKSAMLLKFYLTFAEVNLVDTPRKNVEGGVR